MKTLWAAVRKMAAFVDRWQWAILLLASPWLLFPKPERSLVILVVPALWIIAGLAGRGLLPSTPLNGSLIVMALMVLVSLYATYDIAVSLPKVAGLALGLGAFFAAARLGHQPIWWLRIFMGFVALGVVIAAVGLLGMQGGAKIAFLAPILNRLPMSLRGLPGAEEGLNPNQVAGSLLWIIPAMTMATVQNKRLWRPRPAGASRGYATAGVSLSALAVLFVSSVFVLTQSRSGYLGLAAGLAMMLMVGMPKRWRKWLAVGMIVGLIGLGAILWRGGADQAVQTSLDRAVLPLDSVDGRLEIWSRAIYGIQDFPFTGMGMNTFRHVMPILYPLFTIGPDVDVGHAHNEFLQAALDLGLPGLIAFLALYLGAFTMLSHLWRTADAAPESAARRQIALGLGGGLLAHLVYGLTDAVALGAKPGLVFWLLLGLLAGLFAQTQPARLDSV
jgi:putative inorganic carbon (HCO3(-)) transporter